MILDRETCSTRGRRDTGAAVQEQCGRMTVITQVHAGTRDTAKLDVTMAGVMYVQPMLSTPEHTD